MIQISKIYFYKTSSKYINRLRSPECAPPPIKVERNISSFACMEAQPLPPTPPPDPHLPLLLPNHPTHFSHSQDSLIFYLSYFDRLYVRIYDLPQRQKKILIKKSRNLRKQKCLPVHQRILPNYKGTFVERYFMYLIIMRRHPW
jgi:hypothetical protein